MHDVLFWSVSSGDPELQLRELDAVLVPTPEMVSWVVPDVQDDGVALVLDLLAISIFTPGFLMIRLPLHHVELYPVGDLEESKLGLGLSSIAGIPSGDDEVRNVGALVLDPTVQRHERLDWSAGGSINQGVVDVPHQGRSIHVVTRWDLINQRLTSLD